MSDANGMASQMLPLPHHDHIELDLRAGTARIVSSSTKEEKVVYDRWVGRQLKLLEGFDALLKKSKTEKNMRC